MNKELITLLDKREQHFYEVDLRNNEEMLLDLWHFLEILSKYNYIIVVDMK